MTCRMNCDSEEGRMNFNIRENSSGNGFATKSRLDICFSFRCLKEIYKSTDVSMSVFIKLKKEEEFIRMPGSEYYIQKTILKKLLDNKSDNIDITAIVEVFSVTKTKIIDGEYKQSKPVNIKAITTAVTRHVRSASRKHNV